MWIINFAHPLTEDNLREINTLAGSNVTKVIDVPSYIDQQKSLEQQIMTLVNAVDLTPLQWQTLPLLINLPSLSNSAAVLLAYLHGRMGYFPSVLRLRPKLVGPMLRYEVAEILTLQAVRDRARERR